MTQRIVSVTRSAAWLVALAGIFVLLPRLSAEPVLGKEDRRVTRLVCDFLQQGHLNRPELGEQLSRRLFQRFFKDLDPTKLYFLKSDLEDFRKYETDLADQLKVGDLDFAYKVYDRFMTRLGERQKLIEELVKAPQDFNVKEYLSTDYDHTDYAQSEAELKERWRKRIKFELLMHRIGQKPLPDAESKQKILSRYRSLYKRWKQLDNYELMELYLSDLTASVDPHSSYMSPNTLADFDIAMRLNLEGIGALLRSEDGQTIIAEIIPGGAAAKDGRLKPKDKIIAVAQGDDKFTETIDMKLTEVVKLIRGPKGTKVQLRVVPADKLEPLVYNLTRQKIELKGQEARQEVIEQGKKADGTPYRIGVIDLPSFYMDMASARHAGKGEFKSATEDVRKILKEFISKGVDGVVLDLRHNGGGALTEAQGLTGLFIDEGPVLQVKNSRGKVEQREDPEKGIVYSGPLIVLVSRFSASASEILAGALQDYGRALIVGDSSTHGKGTVQVVLDIGSHLSEESPPKLGALKLTIQQFYRVNGDSTQNRGVSSDIVLPSLTEALGAGEKELENALAFDQVRPVDHEELNLIPADVKAVLKTRSAERVKKSKEFAKILKEAEDLKVRRARKQVPLNEKELREYTKEDADKTEAKANRGELPDDEDGHTDNTVYKFKRTPANNEILQIMEDLIQGKKLVSSR